MSTGSPLDPEDWPDYRRHAHDLLDSLLDHLEHAATGPVWHPVPEQVKERLAQASAAPQDIEEICGELRDLILPYGTGNTHPRFFGWVHGAGTAGGMLAEMTAAALDANCGGRDHGAIYVERAVIDWACRWFSLPKAAGGLLVGGTSMANLLGLAVARHHHAGHDVRAEGLKAAPLVGYTSAEGHSCLTKAFEMLGLGRDALRRLPTNDHYQLDLAALKAAVAADRAAGKRPFCVIATAGTVNSGAADDLTAIAAFCQAEGLWMHVDGAFGATAILSPELAPRLAGIEQADSIAFDFHKWLHVPYDAGCLLVRDQALQLAAFSGRPPYLAGAEGLAGGEPWPCDLGVDLSRGFRALKIWVTLKEQGTARLGAAMANNCRQARLFAELIARRPTMRLMAPVPLNIVCFRYQPSGMTDEAIDRLNARLVAQLQEQGIAAPSTCHIEGRLCIRVCVINHRTQDSDLILLAEAVESIGDVLSQTI